MEQPELVIKSFNSASGNSDLLDTMRPTVITFKQCFCVTDAREKITFQRLLMCIWRLQNVPYGGAETTPRNS